MNREGQDFGLDVHYRHEGENRIALTVAVALLFSAAISFILAGRGIFYAAVFHALTLGAGSVGIFFLFRYTLSYRTLHLQSIGGRRCLVVTDTQGRRISTACHLYLAECEAHYYLARGERAVREDGTPERHRRSFTYQNALLPKKRILLYTETDGGRVCVRLAANEQFYRLLSERITLARMEEKAEAEARA